MTTLRTNRAPIMTAIAADRALRQYLDARTCGRRLAWAREATGISQAELAAYVGVSRGTISNIERGERALRPAERAACARALGCSIATLAKPAIAMPAASSNGNRKAVAA
jgi:transcriptional regulator with XRE-family HTH domain